MLPGARDFRVNREVGALNQHHIPSLDTYIRRGLLTMLVGDGADDGAVVDLVLACVLCALALT